MRPAGDVRLALIQACQELAERGGATLRELAAAAKVGLDAARRAVDNLRRAGVLAVVGERSVQYRNRPVAVYTLSALIPAAGDDLVGLAETMRVWG